MGRGADRKNVLFRYTNEDGIWQGVVYCNEGTLPWQRGRTGLPLLHTTATYWAGPDSMRRTEAQSGLVPSGRNRGIYWMNNCIQKYTLAITKETGEGEG
jgi:hypothetical protein